MFTGVDKMIVAFLSPVVVKGVQWVAETLSISGLDSNAVGMGLTMIVAGAAVYFIPNKSA